MVIYKTTNTVNGKWYIGKDARNKKDYLGSGKILKEAITKYGRDSFIKEILEECNDLVNLSEREKYWINLTQATSDTMSYNLASGGNGGDLSKFIDYNKIDYSNHLMSGATKWYNSLSTEEKQKWHTLQANKRCKGWYVSKIDDPTETYITNIAKWCNEHGIEISIPTRLNDPSHRLFQKQSKGWRIRRSDMPLLPPYINKRKIGHPNITCQGKTWKLVDGKRVWSSKMNTGSI